MITRKSAIISIATAGLAALALAGCSGPATVDPGGETVAEQKIVAVTGFNCGMSGYTQSICDGFEAGAAELPEGFTFEHRAGTDITDQDAVNNLIQTATQLEPAGLIVFTNSPAAQVPMTTAACDAGVKVIILDSDQPTLECESSLIQTDNVAAGTQAGEWIAEHADGGTEVAVVSFPAGQYIGPDDRVAGMTEAIEAAGMKVVATVGADDNIESTRSRVENLLQSQPNLTAIFSGNDGIGAGVSAALEATGRAGSVLHVSVDGDLGAVERIPASLSADVAQNPFAMAKESVLAMARLLQGEDIEERIAVPTLVVDETNRQEYIDNGARF